MNAPVLIQYTKTDSSLSLTERTAYAAAQAKRNAAVRRRTTLSVLTDAVLSSAGCVLALALSRPTSVWHILSTATSPLQAWAGVGSGSIGFLLIYGALLILAGNSQNLYRVNPPRSPLVNLAMVSRSVAIATLVLTAFIYLSDIKTVPRLAVAFTALFSIVALSSWRAFRWYLRGRQCARGIGLQHALIVGAGKVGQRLATYLDENPTLGYKVKGFVDSNHHTDPRMLGKIEELPQIVRQQFIDEIFVTIPSERELVKNIAIKVSPFDLGLKIVHELYDGMATHTPEEFVGDFPVRVLQRSSIPDLGLGFKRLLDVVGSALGLIILAPFLALICLIVKFDSVGPIFYRASRVGKKGRRFVCYKFRTMVARADEQKSGLKHLNERVGPLFKISNDPRVTRFGTFLRKHSLDEFPQLWNVLKGDMSLVGPRPPEFDEILGYRLEHLSRLDATPGITGLWQVSARHDPSFETAVSLDNYYIQNWSLMLDVKIMLLTIPVVLKGLGR